MNYPNSGNFDNQSNNRYGFMDSGYDMYSSNYGSGSPKKNNNNLIIIVLIAVVAFLMCAIIAITAVFILKSNNNQTQTQTKKTTQTSQTTQTNSGVPKTAAKKNNNTYVTCVSNAEVYVRSGPDKSNSIVLKIKGGDTSVKLKSTGNSTFGTDGFIWYEVTIPSGQTAWVRSDVVTLDGPNPYQRKAVKDYKKSDFQNFCKKRSQQILFRNLYYCRRRYFQEARYNRCFPKGFQRIYLVSGNYSCKSGCMGKKRCCNSAKEINICVLRNYTCYKKL